MGRLFNLKQLRLINKYALRDFSRSYKKLWVVTSTLFVSLLLLSLTFSVKEALNSEIENNSKELLGGDIQVTSGVDPLPDEIIDKLKAIGLVSSSIEFATMLSKEGESPVFTELRAVDNRYPLYGEIATSPPVSYTHLTLPTKRIV